MADSTDPAQAFKLAISSDPLIAFFGNKLPLIRKFSASPHWAHATATIALVTILACYALATRHLPDWMTIPPISLTGFLAPERFVYAAGFTLTFVAGLVTARQVRVINSLYTRRSSVSNIALKILHVALICMLIQGIVPFQENALDVLIMNESTLTAQTVIHLIAAGIFFLGCQMHGVLIVADRLVNNRARLPFKFKSVLLLGSIYFLNSKEGTNGDPRADFNAAGLAQRLGVLCILLFYADYARDVKAVVRSSRQQADSLLQPVASQ
jgi:hypothetical protein